MTISGSVAAEQPTNFSTTFDDYLWSHDFIVSTTDVNVSLVIAGTGITYDNVSNNSFNELQTNFTKNSILFIISTSVTLAILTIFTVIGNILVIAAVLLERNLRTPANYLVLSLAVAGAFYEIQGQWSLGDLLCEFWISVDVLCCSARYAIRIQFKCSALKLSDYSTLYYDFYVSNA